MWLRLRCLIILGLLAFAFAKQFPGLETLEEEKEILLETSNGKGDTIANCVIGKIDSKYVYGKAGPTEFDCSGLAQYCHKQAGISIPRTASDQSNKGTSVSMSGLQKGDLVFFNFGSGIAHVGTYIGSGNMVHAANSKKGVRQDPVKSGYWKGVFAKARRYW